MANTSSKPTSASPTADEPIDKIQRGNYKFSVAGAVTWIGLRALDPFIQYQLLFRGHGDGLLSRIGITTASSVISTTPAPMLLSRDILVAMSSGAAAKHIFWILYLGQEYFPPSFATMISTVNLLLDTSATFLVLSSKTSSVSGPLITIPGTQASLPLSVVAGTALFTIGIVTETVAEVQRKWFKANPENKGKIYTRGLWQFARHINYGAYLLWRGAYIFSAGGIAPALMLVGFLLQGFLRTSIPGMDKYMSGKYSAQWEEYKRRTPYLIFPGIF